MALFRAMVCHQDACLLLVLVNCVLAVDYVNVKTKYGTLIGIRTFGNYEEAGEFTKQVDWDEYDLR